MDRYVIVVAGGKGMRMGGELPKQFLPIAGRPILMRTLERFCAVDSEIKMVLVLPQDQILLWQELCVEHHFVLPHQVVTGGETRFDSVKCGLKCVAQTAVVAVHDGVRPFVSAEVIANAYAQAAVHGAVVPVLPVVDSLRCIDTPTQPAGRSVDRASYQLVQTPQVFRSNILHKAYDRPYMPEYTDDASVVEAAGFSITPIEGNRENIKITTPFDMTIARALLSADV